jgi:hypothetical protein
MCCGGSSTQVINAPKPELQNIQRPITQTPIGQITSIEIVYDFSEAGKVKFYPKLNGKYPGTGAGDYNPSWFRMVFQCGAAPSQTARCQLMSVGSYWATVPYSLFDQYVITFFVADSVLPFKVEAFSIPKKP